MTLKQPYFSRGKVKLILIISCCLFALICFGVWWAKRTISISLDWSFLLPFAGFISVVIPLGISISDWAGKRQAAVDDRLDALEAKVNHLILNAKNSQAERDDLRGRVIRQEVTYKAFLGK